MRKPVVLSWSGGKDSALALDALSRDPEVEVVGLLTSVTRSYDRISVHGVRRSMLEAARLVCVDTAQLDAGFAGRLFDEQLLADLPATADPCGERGEFHTFVSDGPLFDAPIPYRLGETVLREQRFMFCDIE